MMRAAKLEKRKTLLRLKRERLSIGSLLLPSRRRNRGRKRTPQRKEERPGGEGREERP